MSRGQPLRQHTRLTIKMQTFLKWCQVYVAPPPINMTWTQFVEKTQATSTADNMKGNRFADAKNSQLYSVGMYQEVFRRIAKSGVLPKPWVEFWQHVIFPAGLKRPVDGEQLELLPDDAQPDDTLYQSRPGRTYEPRDETAQQIQSVRHATAELACRADDQLRMIRALEERVRAMEERHEALTSMVRGEEMHRDALVDELRRIFPTAGIFEVPCHD